jgi:riboflavin kinase/FMN adenylyltransferase
MKRLEGLDACDACRGGHLSIGNFDGVHRGHQRMLARLAERARADNAPAVAFTFEPHPIAVLAPDRAPPRLTTPARKAELIAQCGVDWLVVCHTDRALLELSAEAFFQQVIRDRFQARGLVEGPSFGFGKGRAGNVETLARLCAAAGLALEIVPAERRPTAPGDGTGAEGSVISSSAIRQAITDGHLAEACVMLGHPYRLSGVVERGAERGRTLGFPTANLGQIETLLPGAGVYAGRAQVGGECFPAAIHVGDNPTFGDGTVKVEAHLLDFEGDLYGIPLEVDLFDRVRATMRFVSPEELIRQVRVDLTQIRERVGAHPTHRPTSACAEPQTP